MQWFSSWRRLATCPLPPASFGLRVVPAVSRTIALCSPAVLFLLPVGFSRCLLLFLRSLRSFLRQAPFGAASFLTAAGVGPRQSGFLQCQSSLDPPLRLCRGESHSGALLTLSLSCQVGCPLTAFLLFFALTHTPRQHGLFTLAYSLCTHFPNVPSHLSRGRPFPLRSALFLSHVFFSGCDD
jgi:hypothetical protein